MRASLWSPALDAGRDIHLDVGFAVHGLPVAFRRNILIEIQGTLHD
jgi:hypothetical protein